MAEDRVRIIFEEDGYPRELTGESDRERAIRTGSLTPETSVILYRAGAAPVATRARHVAELRALFGDLADEPEPAPGPPPGPPMPPAPVPQPAAEHREAPPRDRPPEAPKRPARTAPLMRGANVSLSRAAPGLRQLSVGIGWDVTGVRSGGLELDLFVFLQDARGKVRGDCDVVFYNNEMGANGAVRLSAVPGQDPSGDVLAVAIELDALDSDIARMSFAVVIYDGAGRNQNFGMVAGAYIRVVNRLDHSELARCEISQDSRTETVIVFGEIYNRAGEWKFKAIDQGYSGGLAALATAFGVDLAHDD